MIVPGVDCYADAEKEVTAAYSGSGARLGAGLGMILWIV